jgi:hypothetical protein
VKKPTYQLSVHRILQKIKTLPKKLFIIPLVLIILLEAVVVISPQSLTFASISNIISPSHTYTITLTKNGFKPNIITVSQGDSVIFKSEKGVPFWPASDLHPTHTIYSEFDPKRPIESKDSWQFQFQRVGQWDFHDHLDPLFKGRIIVKASNKSAVITSSDSCKNNETDSCWSTELRDTIKKQGLQKGFDLFTNLFNTQPKFAENCHSYTHILGEEGYGEFERSHSFPVTPQLAYCSYGFFHGFIEAMFHKDGNLEKAKELCEYIDSQMKNQTSSLSACYHGIGHGVTDASNPQSLGDPEAIIKPGLELCEKVSDVEFNVKLCGTGVFNSLAIMFADKKYGLKVDPNDPFYTCRQQQKTIFRHGCYDDFKTLLFYLAGNDFVKAAHYIEEVPETDYAVDAMDNLATYYIYFILQDKDASQAINKCHTLQPRLHNSCIAGLGAGFMTAGTPDREYIQALAVCTSKLITTEERSACYNRIIPLIRLRYSQDKYQAICQTIEPNYKSLCL